MSLLLVKGETTIELQTSLVFIFEQLGASHHQAYYESIDEKERQREKE